MLATESARIYILRSETTPRHVGRHGHGTSRGGKVSTATDQSSVFPTRESMEPKMWRGDAACRDTDPDLFFPVGQTGPAIAHIENAKAVCQTCDVRVECLEYALMTNQDAGIWGGLTEDERRPVSYTHLTLPTNREV